LILKQKYDNKIDVFSLGCIFYEMVIETPLSSIDFFIGEDISKDKFDISVIEKNIKEKISPQVFFTFFFLMS
jgi:serine/threonine protein kinase